MATGGAMMMTESTTAAAPAAATRALVDFFLAELDREARPTRKMLERVPMERAAWQPHPKSMAIGSLATHLANLPSWTAMTLNQDELDIAPVNAPPLKMEPLSSVRDLLELFDKNIADARQALAASTDAQLEEDWTLLAGGH
jgi:hypothetical protein